MFRSAPTTIIALVSVSLVLLRVSINTGITKQQTKVEGHRSEVLQVTAPAWRSGITTGESVKPSVTRGEMRSMLSLATERASKPQGHQHPLPEQNTYGSATMAPIDLLIPPWHQKLSR